MSNKLDDYANIILNRFPDFLPNGNKIYYDYDNVFIDSYERDVSCYFSPISLILTYLNIDFEEVHESRFFVFSPNSDDELQSIIRNVFLNENISKELILHMLYSTPGFEDVIEEFEALISNRDNIFKMTEEEYLMWRMSI